MYAFNSVWEGKEWVNTHGSGPFDFLVFNYAGYQMIFTFKGKIDAADFLLQMWLDSASDPCKYLEGDTYENGGDCQHHYLRNIYMHFSWGNC